MDNGYINGFLELTRNGFAGNLQIAGISVSPIIGQYFSEGTDKYLRLKRAKVLEYDNNTQSYHERDARPKWECYLKKQTTDNAVAYKGEFFFMRFKFSITGVWDNVLGNDKKHRLNLFVERLPMNQQTIINNIRERRRNE